MVMSEQAFCKCLINMNFMLDNGGAIHYNSEHEPPIDC